VRDASAVDPTDPPVLAVVVPTYRRPEGLARLLEALARQTLPPERWELVVVDDAGGPETAAVLDRLVAGSPLTARVVHLVTNEGPAAARNAGWRSTTAPLVAFTDDDCVPRPDWLASGLKALEAAAEIGVVQGRTVRPAGSDGYPYTCFTVVREVLAPSPWFEGCNLFFRRPALEAAGGFDETIGWFGEETALGWSVIEAGWQRGWADNATVEHDLSERPWRWHLRNHYLEGNIVRIAARHPGIRSMFWRPWAIKRENALFTLALLGLLMASRRRIGLLLTIPYLRGLPRPWHGRGAAIGMAHQASVHAASLAGKAVAAVEQRSLLL
jgi:GT2 family glycosyltransferase